MSQESSANRTKLDHEGVISSEQLAARLGRWDDGPGSLYRRLAGALGELIDSGVLRHGERLPPERRLAATLSVARGTVVRSYSLLAERGLVDRVQGSGTRVTGLAAAAADVRHGAPHSDGLFARHGAAIDLRMAMPSLSERTGAAIARVRLPESGAGLLADAEPAGVLALRERIARHMTEQGLPTSPWQVMVTAGAQQAIVLATAALVSPGDVVLAEAATWPGLVDAVVQRGGRVHGVPLDRDGIVPDALDAAIRRLRPVAIGLNPHHHNPTGTRLSLERRRSVAEIAASYRVPIIEDRALAQLAFDRQVPPPLAHHAAEHLVVDSVNKVAWPGLRIGWLRGDAELVERLRPLRAVIDLYSPLHSQLAAIEILDDWDAIVADRIDGLRPAADLLVDELRRRIPDWDVPRPRGGLVVWAGLPDGGASAFCEHAARHGVLIAPGRQFGVEAPFDDEHVRIPFTAAESVVSAGIDRLADAWETFDRGPVRYAAAAVV